MKVYSSFLFTVVWCLLSITGFGQHSQIEGIQYSDELITISTELEDCISTQNGIAKQYLIVTIENKSQDEVEVKFNKELWYDGSCINCQNVMDEYATELKINPDGSISGSCDSSKDLKIFFKMLNLKNVRQLTHYEFKNVEVIKL